MGRLAAATAATLALAAGLAFCAAARAQTVSMGGSLGDKALLIVDGTPRTVAAGASVQGVKLVAVSGDSATVEVKGRRIVLRLGGAQVSLGGGGAAEGSGSQIVISAGSGGHFFSDGAINGKAVRFLVDTGATYVSIGAAEAERLGIDYRKGQRGSSATANGQIAVYRVALDSVRIGDVLVYNVEAVVTPMQMDHVLLGNSFLTRFQMKRENDLLMLSRRY